MASERAGLALASQDFLNQQLGELVVFKEAELNFFGGRGYLNDLTGTKSLAITDCLCGAPFWCEALDFDHGGGGQNE